MQNSRRSFIENLMNVEIYVGTMIGLTPLMLSCNIKCSVWKTKFTILLECCEIKLNYIIGTILEFSTWRLNSEMRKITIFHLLLLTVINRMQREDKIIEILAWLLIIAIVAFCFRFNYKLNNYDWNTTTTTDVGYTYWLMTR